jgi:L-rhamnose mutarotase
MNKNSTSTLPIILVTLLFFLWDLSYGVLDAIKKHFQETLNAGQRSSLLQDTFFLIALLAGFLCKKRVIVEEYKSNLFYEQEVLPGFTAKGQRGFNPSKDSGIEQMEIYIPGTRLFMIMEVNDDFSFERKAAMDQNNTKVQKWEELMWKYQEPLEEAAQGEKWMLLNKIFDLNDIK